MPPQICGLVVDEYPMSPALALCMQLGVVPVARVIA